MNTYEVVLFENKDGTEKYVQVWKPGYDWPSHYTLYFFEKKFLCWRIRTGQSTWSSGDINQFLSRIDHSKRVDTEKFPDLDKIKKFNEYNGITPVQVIKHPPARP